MVFAGSTGRRTSDAIDDCWPQALGQDAFTGLVGTFVRTVEPHTEADPAALLVQMLVAFGNVVGASPHFLVEAERQRMNLFAAIVGRSSKARKGTSWAHVKRAVEAIDSQWYATRVQAGLSSGEGLIFAVRDSKGEDIGVADKRLLVVESEFAKPLAMMTREGNVLSAVIREAWDSGNLHVLTKNNPTASTGAHLSIVGHITLEDLDENLSRTDVANGFGNRFLWVLSRRSKLLPEGGAVPQREWTAVIDQLRDAVGYGRQVTAMTRDADARARWREVYEALSAEHSGAYGHVTSRAEAQVTRLAGLYALLDRTATISRGHLDAALAVWRYCDDSARAIFCGPTSSPSLVERIHKALLSAKDVGLTRTEIRDLFGRNLESAQITEALEQLRSDGFARQAGEKTGGRPAERWFFSDPHQRFDALEDQDGEDLAEWAERAGLMEA